MPVRWRDGGFDALPIIKALEERRSVKDGNPSFTDFRFSELASILTTMLDLGNLTEVDADALVNKAIFVAAKNGRLSKDSIADAAKGLMKEHLRLPEDRFTLVTSLSVKRRTNPLSLRVRGFAFKFGSIGKRLLQEHQEHLVDAQKSFPVNLPTGYMPVAVRCKGRTVAEAAISALDATELLRAIWNFQVNSGRSMRLSFGGQRKPVNSILMGPVHTLHLRDGSCLSQWWYEPQYSGPIDPFDPTSLRDRMVPFRKKVMQLLKHHPFREVIENGLIRYSKALDLRDWDSSYLQLWAVLELLTITGGESYSVTIRRAAAIYRDREFCRQELMHLRDRRNRLIHEGKENRDSETLIFQLKRYIEGLIQFHLGPGRKFANVGEVVEFLDLSPNNSDLARRSRLLRRARKFHASE